MIGFKSNKNILMGGWFDNSTGLYYLDLSIHLENKDISLLMGGKFEQKAVFDIKDLNSIYV